MWQLYSPHKPGPGPRPALLTLYPVPRSQAGREGCSVLKLHLTPISIMSPPSELGACQRVELSQGCHGTAGDASKNWAECEYRECKNCLDTSPGTGIINTYHQSTKQQKPTQIFWSRSLNKTNKLLQKILNKVWEVFCIPGRVQWPRSLRCYEAPLQLRGQWPDSVRQGPCPRADAELTLTMSDQSQPSIAGVDQ